MTIHSTAILNVVAAGLIAACSMLGVSMLGADAALAHHAMDGGVPETFEQGLISGLAHPVIGFDHLAFVIGVGLAAALAGGRWLSLPAAFVVGTLAGCGLNLAGVTLPLAEIVIAVSVLAVGVLVMTNRTMTPMALAAAFAAAGLFHGFAYGASIIGAEQTPLVAYLAGFAAVQFVVASLATLAGVQLLTLDAARSVQVRLAGAVITGIGLTFLIENVEGMVFPGL